MTWLYYIKNALNGKIYLKLYTELAPIESTGLLADGFFDTDDPYSDIVSCIDKKYLRLSILGSYSTVDEAENERQSLILTCSI